MRSDGVGSRSEKGARVECGEGETVNNFSPASTGTDERENNNKNKFKFDIKNHSAMVHRDIWN